MSLERAHETLRCTFRIMFHIDLTQAQALKPAQLTMEVGSSTFYFLQRVRVHMALIRTDE